MTMKRVEMLSSLPNVMLTHLDEIFSLVFLYHLGQNESSFYCLKDCPVNKSPCNRTIRPHKETAQDKKIIAPFESTSARNDPDANRLSQALDALHCSDHAERSLNSMVTWTLGKPCHCFRASRSTCKGIMEHLRSVYPCPPCQDRPR